MPENEILIEMVRGDLEGTPRFDLPAPFEARWYEPGFERHWVDIHILADEYNTATSELFRGQFGEDAGLLAERQCYLFDGERAIGTASAWFDDNFHGERVGRVHWVAIVPDYQGRGLAKPLMTRVCDRLRDLGHGRTCLTTSTFRVPAVNLYLKFGFEPFIVSERDRRAWRGIEDHLSRPIELG